MFETTLLRYSWKRKILEAILTINNQQYILRMSNKIKFNTLPIAHKYLASNKTTLQIDAKQFETRREKETDVKIDKIIPWTTLIEGLSDQFIGMISVSPIRPVLCLFVHPLLCMQLGPRVS